MANTTWNPSDKTAGVTLTGSNLTAAVSLGFQMVRSVDRQVTGRFYWEYTFTSPSNIACGITNQLAALGTLGFAIANSGNAAYINNSGTFLVNTVNVAALGAISTGNVVCFALDLDQQLIWVRLGAAGNWNASASANPATFVGGVAVPFVGGGIPAYAEMSSQNATSGAAITANFGDTAFSGAVPSGFTAGFTTGTPAANELTTQIALEEWAAGTPDLQLTQIAVEHWAMVSGLEGRTKAVSFTRSALTVTGGVTTIAGGAGGGGAGGLYGPGEYGAGGQYDGTGGYGGAADNSHTPRQLTPSTLGNTGIEWNGTTLGSGSGGSGGSWGGSGLGGNGGVGGQYGGGGGGGGGGLAGGGLGGLGGEGVIYLTYNPGTGPITIVLTSASPSTYTFPANWSLTNNTVLIVGAGGCGGRGGLTTGGNGGGGGLVVGAVNTDLYSPGQVIPVVIPTAAQVCAGTGGNTSLGTSSATPGLNGDGTTAGTPSVPITPIHGGIGGGTGITGGGGGPGGGGAGGGVAMVVAGRIGAHSAGMVAYTAAPTARQYAVTVVS